MSYKIEFLTESTDETSVCHSADAEAATLHDAEREAVSSLPEIAGQIDGYQIRDDSGAIVLLHHLYP